MGPGRQFEPQIVRKRQRRLGGAGEIVLSLCRIHRYPPMAAGLTGAERGCGWPLLI